MRHVADPPEAVFMVFSILGLFLLGLGVLMLGIDFGRFVPEAKLYEDSYIDKVSRRYWKFILFCRWVGGALFGIWLLMVCLQGLDVVPAVGAPFEVWLDSALRIGGSLLLLGVGWRFVRSDRRTPRKTDVWDMVNLRRALKESGTPAPGSRDRAGCVGVIFVLAIAALAFALYAAGKV